MFHTIYSGIFHPCYLLLLFPLLYFPPLQFCPYRIFYSRIFCRPAAARISGGSEFHAAGPACDKVRAPNLVHSGELAAGSRSQTGTTRSSATARPSCLVGVLCDIYRETIINKSTANQPLLRGHESYRIPRNNGNCKATTPFKVIQDL